MKKLQHANKRVRNLAVSKESWDISEVIRDKHGINKNIPGLGPQNKRSILPARPAAAEATCLSRMTPNWRMRKWNTELAYCRKDERRRREENEEEEEKTEEEKEVEWEDFKRRKRNERKRMKKKGDGIRERIITRWFSNH